MKQYTHLCASLVVEFDNKEFEIKIRHPDYYQLFYLTKTMSEKEAVNILTNPQPHLNSETIRVKESLMETLNTLKTTIIDKVSSYYFRINERTITDILGSSAELIEIEAGSITNKDIDIYVPKNSPIVFVRYSYPRVFDPKGEHDMDTYFDWQSR
jgi:hypothetical protein